MHTDNKAANHGKQVNSDGRSQIPGVNQQQQQGGVPGVHGAKTGQVSLGNPGQKVAAAGQSVSGGMLKTKSKRERSVSMDSGESRSGAPAPALEPDAKAEGVMRSKRRCVLTKKQPYSGDEWCSGPDTDDEDKPRSGSQRPIPGHSDRLPAGNLAAESGAAVIGSGPALKAELPQPSQQVVYVFTTCLANSAAEAVMKGQSDSILRFHQQNVPNSKLEQGYQQGKLPNLPEKVNSSCSPLTGTPKSQSGTPRPASAGVGGPSSAGHSDSESGQVRPAGAPSSNNGAPQRTGGGLRESISGADSGAASSPSGGASILSAHLQGDALQKGSRNMDCLSKEQLEHRERSLQTLRDIERLLLRSGEPGGPSCGSANNPTNLNNTDRSGAEDGEIGTNASGNCANASMLPKKYEEPLQSMISQTQSLGGAVLDNPRLDSHHNLPPPLHHQMHSPVDNMAPLMGPEGLTREQMAWRKLKEEYYQEKRRQHEIEHPGPPQHFRMIPEAGMHGAPMMIRGPPPPYHNKPGDQQWDSGNLMRRGIGGNGKVFEMHPEGPRGPRFLGQIQRGQPGGGGFPGSLEGLGPQRPIRPGMIWLEDVPNSGGGGGPFHGCYPGGAPQHFQDDAELLAREEMFRIMEKRQMQVSRFELDRLAKQQQQGNMGPRIMDGFGGADFPNLVMVRGPPSGRVDPMDFPGSREIMGSPGACHPMRDLVDSPLGSNIPMGMNPQMTLQQQQMMMSQRLRGGPLPDMFGPGEISGRGGNKGMMPGPDGPFQFPSQGPYPEGQVDGSFLQQPGPEMFGPDQPGPNQLGATSRLSHLPQTEGLRGADLASRNAPEMSVSVNSLASPSVPPPHQLKSPSLNQEPSPLLPSPSAPGLKSPLSNAGHHPGFPPASGAGTPCSSSLKSPQLMASSNLGLHSPSASPGQLKSPAMAVGSPGWTSPKVALPSPGGPTGGKPLGNGGNGSTEAGQPHPPRSSSSTPLSQPASMNASMPFTSSPGATPSQNPLSLIMSQMSKYAVPSSTPLYHDAIKTIATSDDEMLSDRPLLSGVTIGGNMANAQMSQMLNCQGSIGPQNEPQSPMGLVSQGQQHLSHDAPGPELGMPAMSSVIMGGGAPDGMGPSSASPLSAGFPRMQPPMHSPIGGMPPNFPQPSDDILPHQQLQMLSKGHHHQRAPHPPDSFPPLPLSDGPDLSEVIRPTQTGIPEFDLSRIIPSDKPSSTLQYFPKSEPHQNPHQQHTPQQLLKQLSQHGGGGGGSASCNPHLASLQSMAEQQLPPHPSHGVIRQGMGGSRAVMSAGGAMCPPGHMMGRTGMMPPQQQPAMMANNLLHHPSGPYPGMMPPQQHPHSLMTQQNIMMMQAKQRSMSIPGEPFGHQGPMVGPPHPQAAMMGQQQPLRQRGMTLDSPIAYGSGGMANMPF
ncbi:B-cell CLL/lymphoma 9-like protein [Xiphophorus maculatus]|uniref:Bcl9 like n=1 Tax=Xiphophorus maculatus TaxID=8083 RepID=M3ZZK9_XIPMA|nr:B-cell CLL/lymphoma 9-like protein [Xiphophorus maculatus]XP_023206978.1 B-cell CLL/lymphoma 9-like protein [Xiphophorus maculatus]